MVVVAVCYVRGGSTDKNEVLIVEVVDVSRVVGFCVDCFDGEEEG